MDAKQKKALLFVGALIALALLFWMKSRNVPVPVATQPAPSQDPIDWPNGIYPGPDNMWGGSPFDSTINVNIGPGAGWLASHYMPAFGLVGVTAVKG